MILGGNWADEVASYLQHYRTYLKHAPIAFATYSSLFVKRDSADGQLLNLGGFHKWLPRIWITNRAFYRNELRNYPVDIVSVNQSRALTFYFGCDLSLDLVYLEISALSYTLPFPHKGLKPITST